jgi:DNA repair ATPase RecN
MYPGAEKVKDMILWWASLNGPMALPGNYKVSLTVGDITKSQNFTILKNPISETNLADATAQFNFINDINTKVTEIHKALKNVKKVRAQVTSLQKSISDKLKHSELLDYADSLLKEIKVIEETLYQTKSKSNQDPLNFPIRLNNKLAHLNSLTRIGSYAPTEQAINFKNEITEEIDNQLSKLYDLFKIKVKVLNQKVKDSQIDLIQLD